ANRIVAITMHPFFDLIAAVGPADTVKNWPPPDEPAQTTMPIPEAASALLERLRIIPEKKRPGIRCEHRDAGLGNDRSERLACATYGSAKTVNTPPSWV